MYVLKKVLIVSALGAAVILFSSMFHYTELSHRIIVFGLGIDFEDGAHLVSAEVAIPVGGVNEGTVGTGKVFEGKGNTIALALMDLYKKSGKVPSLGQCNIIIFGEDYYKSQNIAEAASFFSYADEISDGILLSTCSGKAADYLKNTVAGDPYISSSLQKTIQASADKVGTAKVTIKDFMNKQYDLTKDAFLTHIDFIKTDTGKTESGEQSQGGGEQKNSAGYFTADKATVFKKGVYAGTLDDNIISSLMFLTQKRAYQSFEVEDEPYEGQIFPRKIGVGVASKTVCTGYELDGKPVVNISIFVRLKKLRNNVEDELILFIPKKHEDLSETAKRDIENQIIKNIENTIKTSKDMDCDFICLAKSFYAEHGTKFERYTALRPDWLQEVKFNITCTSY